MSCLQGTPTSSGSGSNNANIVKKGSTSSKKIPKFPEHPEKPMDLSSMVPPTSAVSSGTLWSHPSSNFHQQHQQQPQRSGSSASSNPISEHHPLHYYTAAGDFDDPYMVIDCCCWKLTRGIMRYWQKCPICSECHKAAFHQRGNSIPLGH